MFQKFGKTMRRVVWYPKGQLPSGGITRKAVRDARTLTDDEMWIKPNERGSVLQGSGT